MTVDIDTKLLHILQLANSAAQNLTTAIASIGGCNDALLAEAQKIIRTLEVSQKTLHAEEKSEKDKIKKITKTVEADLEKVKKDLNRIITQSLKKELNQQELNALLSDFSKAISELAQKVKLE